MTSLENAVVRRPWSSTLTALLLLVVLSARARGNDQALDRPEQIPSPAADASTTPTDKRPGKYRLGPFYLTPRFHFGPVGLDSNVLYTATDRQADVMISLGPGLDAVLPLGSVGRFYSSGSLDYLYFVRTESQRRFTGLGMTGLAFKGANTEATFEERYATTYGRPNYEVDQRVFQIHEGTTGNVRRHLFGGISLILDGHRLHSDTPSVDYLGTDLGLALTTDTYGAGGELRFRLSVKSAFVVNGGMLWTRYPLEPVRDSDRQLLAGGFRTEPSALVSGHLLLGQRWYTPKLAGASTQRLFYVDIDETLNLSPRTRFNVSYLRDIMDSVFLPDEGTATNRSEAVGIRIEREFTHRIDLRIFGRLLRNRSDGAITIDDPNQGPTTSVRDDKVREAGADLGYRFRPNFRFGIIATYSERDSTFSYFGVDGLLVGFNAQFNP